MDDDMDYDELTVMDDMDDIAEEDLDVEDSGAVDGDAKPLFQRYGYKKALAPFITPAIVLRQFVDECEPVLVDLEQSALLAPFHEFSVIADDNDLAPEIVKRNRERKKQLSQNRKIKVDSGKDKAELLRRQLGSTMLDLRKRIKQAGPSFFESSLSVDKCISQAPKLITLRNRKADQALVEREHRLSMQFTRSLYAAPYVQDLFRRVGKNGGMVEISKELRITVRIYRGRIPLKLKSHRNLHLLQVQYCLGSSTLKDIINRIPCSTFDQEEESAFDAQDEFVFIENTFFVEDVEAEESKATHYHDWLKSTQSLQTDMQSLTTCPLQDISIALGQPYLYKHGPVGCEHFIVFSDVRFLHRDDEQDQSRYPRVIFQECQKYPTCAGCGAKSRWQVINSNRYPKHTSFVCDTCNTLFNFNSEGVQIEPDMVLIPLSASGVDTDESSQEPSGSQDTS